MHTYTFTRESKYGSKFDSMKKAERENNPNRWIYFDLKSTLNVLVSKTFISNMISEELFTQWERLSRWPEQHGWLQNDLYISKLTYLCVFLGTKWKNPTISNIFPRAKQVLNTFDLRKLCAHLYLFVVYILFAPVISQASIAVWTILLISKSWWRS